MLYLVIFVAYNLTHKQNEKVFSRVNWNYGFSSYGLR